MRLIAKYYGVLVRRRFEAILDLFDEDEALQEQFLTVTSEVSAMHRNIHPYLVCFRKNITELYASVMSRQQ